MNDPKQVMSFLRKAIRYKSDFSGDALSPVETLAAGAGVCLEYANLACALINILRPGECSVIIGLMTLTEPENCHAWIELGGEQYEPQSGKLLSSYGPGPEEANEVMN